AELSAAFVGFQGIRHSQGAKVDQRSDSDACTGELFAQEVLVEAGVVGDQNAILETSGDVAGDRRKRWCVADVASLDAMDTRRPDVPLRIHESRVLLGDRVVVGQ